MILNRDCFFYKKSDFINRQSELSPDSIVYIADTHQIYTHGAFFECALTTAKVKELIENYGYLTPADLPELTGGSAPLEGTYIDGVTVGGHNITIHRGNFSEINVGSATKLENPRDIILSGDISGQVSFDGTKDVTIETTVHNSETADRLTNPRTISLIGQSSGSAYFDGSRDISIETTTNNLNSVNANNKDLNSLVTLNGYLGNLFYGAGGNTSLNKPENVDSFGLFTFKSASGNYSTQILGSSLDRIYVRSGADSSLGDWNTIAYLTDNVASATKLQNTRTFTVSDGQHTGSSSNFDGTSNVVLDLPDIINADVIGNLTGDITGNVTGDLYGNADTATKLETGRNINGTLFDGTEDIITNQWGTSRNIGIVNSDGSGTPIPVSVNGSSNVNLKLPATIKADITGDLNGNADTASKLQTPVDINLSGDATGSVSFDGSKDVTINVDVNTASKLENAFTLTLGGDTTGSVSIDGSKNVTLSVTVKDNSHNHTVSNITDLNSTWDKYLTEGGLYERNLVMNGTTYSVFTDVSGASTMTWYAPTTAGTSGYILQSTGGIPQWISISTLGSLLDSRYVNVSGDTMTGGLTLPGNQTYAFNSLGLMFSDNTGRIGTNNKGELGIYAKTDIYLRPDSSTNSSNTGLYISSDVITYNNYPLLHSNNYTDYVYSKSQSDSRYVKNGEGVDTAYIRYAGINGSNYNFLSNVDNQYPFMIYAPTSAGSNNQWLRSTGGVPIWDDISKYVLTPDNYTTTLDGRYVKKTGDTMTGGLTINNGGLWLSSNGVTSHIKSENDAWLHFYTDGLSGFYFDTKISVKGEIYAGDDYKQLVWNAGNDGSGSGLDADLLDGTHKSGLFTALSSTSSTNLSVTIGGTTKTITDLYANYADTAGSVNWINVTSKPDFSKYATISWVTDNFDSVSISRDQTSGVRIAVINVSGTSYSLYAPTAEEVSLTWDSISGKPSCYTPCDHGHHFDDITFNNDKGDNRKYLAGDGRFYTIAYSEISGTPVQYSLPILSNSTLGGAKVNLKRTRSCSFGSSHTSTSSSVTINSRTSVSGRYYAVEADSQGYLFVNVPWEAGESGGGITSINDAAGSSTATGYLITNASGSTVYRRALKKEDITNVLGDDYDTKNTAGSTNSTSKLFLIGAKEQSANPVTYSESGCYISGGQLYSDSELVATQPWVQSWVENNLAIDFSIESTFVTNLKLTINGRTEYISNLYAEVISGYHISVANTAPDVMSADTIYFVY